MIITRTPYRISFFGGGTDYKRFYEQHGGLVLTATIDAYCHVLLRKMPPFLGSKYRVFWSKAESVDRVEDIEHPGVRGCLQYLGIEYGIEVNHAGDLPARSGLGSSSEFTVGMLHALHALEPERATSWRADLACEAIAVEQTVLGETVGIQDQIQCAWGGLNVIRINQDGNYALEPIVLSAEQVRDTQDHLLLLFTNIQRFASEIAAEQVDNVDRKRDELLGLMDMVPCAVRELERGDMESFGELLHDSWLIKRELSSKVSTPEIDETYAKALKAGAWGGKILGAGGGGFMLICCPPEKRQAIIDATGLISFPVRFEYGGSELVHRS